MKVRYALAAFKAEPHRVQMAERAERGHDRCVAPKHGACDCDRRGAFEHVAKKRGRSEAFSAGRDPSSWSSCDCAEAGVRTSGAPASRVMSTPNGIEPHR